MSTTFTTTCNQCACSIYIEKVGEPPKLDERIHMDTLEMINREEARPMMEDVDFCSAKCCATFIFHHMDTVPTE